MNFNYDFKRYKKVARTGLKNLGDTSYLNAVMQCLGNIYDLANYFLNPINAIKINKNIEKYTLSFPIGRLYAHLYPFPEKENREIYTTENIFKILAIMGNYKDYNRRVPTELIIFILEQLQKELNEKEPQNIDQNEISSDNNNKEKEQIMKEFIMNYKQHNYDVISNNFNYFSLKEHSCQKCNNKNYFPRAYNYYDLNIKKCSENCKNVILSIKDCLNFLSQNMVQNTFCSNCKEKTNFNIFDRIYSSSKIFVFILDREDLNEKLMKIPFKLDESIDLSNFIEDNNSYKNYNLIGIVSISLREKKYIGFSKSPIDKQWYLYNDENVKKINIDFVKKSHEEFNFYVPYILFYESSDNVLKINSLLY